MERRHIGWLGAGLLGLALAPAAHAGGFGGEFYMGGDLGEVSAEEFFDGFDFDASTDAWRLYGGWRLSDYLGAEVGYVNFGELDERIDIGTSFVPVSADAEGYTVAGTVGWPVTDSLILTGRGGFLFWDSENRVDDIRFDESDENFFYGAGLRVDFSRHFSVTGDWTRYELDTVEVEMVSAGIQFRFR
ncbi:porin family protein [Lentisalinibacter orientalis]|uniref:porin family protein n=1 Tax=Lentisalinibacter orientalis TaxID=2992241 RepID=UPI00386EBB8F